MLIKFLLVCGAPGGVLRQSEPLLLQEVFSFSFFDFVQTAEPEAGWVKKSSHVTLRRSVCFHRVGCNRQKHFNKCSGFFFLSWTNWTLPQHFPACFYSNLQLHHSDFTSPRKLSSSILAGSDRQLVLKKACFSMAWSVDWWRKQAKEVDCSVTP